MRGGCPRLRGGHPQHLLPLAILPGSHRHDLILSRNVYISKCFIARTDFNHGLLGVIQGFTIHQMMTSYRFYPKGYGIGLQGVYAVWALVVLLLYPFCRWVASV